MPLYEYSDSETGVRIELRRAVEDRDKPIVLKREKTVPDRLSIHGLGPTPEQDFHSEVMQGLYAREQQQGSRLQTAEFTKAQIKKAWSE